MCCSMPLRWALFCTTSNCNCFCSIKLINYRFSRSELSNDPEDVVLAHDQVIFVVDFNLDGTVFGDQDLVADLYIELDFLAFIIEPTSAEGDNRPFLRLLFRRVRNDDASLLHFLFFERLNQYAITERFHIYRHMFYLLLLDLMQGCTFPSHQRRKIVPPPPQFLKPKSTLFLVLIADFEICSDAILTRLGASRARGAFAGLAPLSARLATSLPQASLLLHPPPPTSH